MKTKRPNQTGFTLIELLVVMVIIAQLLPPAEPKVSAQPVPHHFAGIAVTPEGVVTLSLEGSVSNLVPGLTGTISNQFMNLFDLYIIESSSNLVDWTPTATLLRTNNDPAPLLFQNRNVGNFSRQFYRTFTNQLLTMFPKPTGPYTVGTMDRVMVDPTRTNLYRYSPATNAFMVSFWYPAEPAQAGMLPSPMWSRRFATDSSWIFYSALNYDTRWAKVLPLCVGHRFANLPVASNAGRLPVVIYSHGNRASRIVDTQRAEELASHGYLVIAPDHGDCYATEFPDGSYLYGSSGYALGRLQDMKFLLDELARLNQNDAILRDRLDLDRIGLCGHSYGGLVVETCRTDPRAKCAVLFDAANLKYNSAGLQKPFLLLTAPRSQFPDIRLENEWLFNQAITHAIWLDIKDADHFTFFDTAWGPQVPWGGHLSEVASTCTLWFYDTYLKGEVLPFPTNPEIINLKYKGAFMPPVFSRYSVPNHRSYQPANTTFSFRVTSEAGVSATTGLSLVVNGLEQIAQASVTGTANSLNVVFSQFPANVSYRLDLKATDINGRVSQETRYFDTLQESNFTIEAEDFNYGGGQFIERATWAPNLYDPYGTNYVGVQQVDCFEPSFSYTVDNGADPNTAGLSNHEYRWADTNNTPPTGEWIATEGINSPRLSQDQQVRQKIVTAVEATQDLTLIDYNICETQVGEWWNYTRTFPAGRYKVYARLASSNNQGFTLNFYQVQGPANTENQVLTRLGAFHHPSSTGSSRSYWFFPLQDDLDQEVVLDLSGLTTVHGEVAAGNLNANFFMFVPVSPSGN